MSEKRSIGAVRPASSGITGVSGGIKSIGQLAQLLRPNFLPASQGQAPLAGGAPNVTPNTGRRSVIPAVQQTKLYLVAGATTWTFNSPFKFPPIVVATPVGAAAGATVFLVDGTPTTTSVSISSTSNTDVRLVHLIAIGNPN